MIMYHISYIIHLGIKINAHFNIYYRKEKSKRIVDRLNGYDLKVEMTFVCRFKLEIIILNKLFI